MAYFASASVLLCGGRRPWAREDLGRTPGGALFALVGPVFLSLGGEDTCHVPGLPPVPCQDMCLGVYKCLFISHLAWGVRMR